MQLFCIKPECSGKERIISGKEIVHQITRVLRMNVGDVFCLQREEGRFLIREEVKIVSLTKQEIVCLQKNCKKTVKKLSKTTMLIAVPNSSAKIDLIVQKLTEIGVGNIIFWKAERSQGKFNIEKKLPRLASIAKEAVEQSWGYTTPTISYVSSLQAIEGLEQCIVCDTPDKHDKGNYKTLDTYSK